MDPEKGVEWALPAQHLFRFLKIQLEFRNTPQNTPPLFLWVDDLSNGKTYDINISSRVPVYSITTNQIT